MPDGNKILVLLFLFIESFGQMISASLLSQRRGCPSSSMRADGAYPQPHPPPSPASGRPSRRSAPRQPEIKLGEARRQVFQTPHRHVLAAAEHGGAGACAGRIERDAEDVDAARAKRRARRGAHPRPGRADRRRRCRTARRRSAPGSACDGCAPRRSRRRRGAARCRAASTDAVRDARAAP